MSETSKSVDLKLMEEIDVELPFTVEIFYESDDDKSPTNESENNENNQAKDLDAILSDIIGDITKASEKSKQIDHASSKNRRLSSESCPVKRAKVNEKVDGHGIQIAKKLNQTENIQNDQVVYREEAPQSSINNQILYNTQSSNDIRGQANDQCAKYNQHTVQSQQIMTNTTWQDTNNNTRLCAINNSFTANTRQTSEGNNNEQTFISSLNSQNSIDNSFHPLTSLSQMIVSQCQVDLHTSECIGALLTTVSSHLVNVMKAWTEYMQVHKSMNKQPLAVEIAFKKYRETKYHLFYLSFAPVNNTLLPKENDHVFIKKFIEYTLHIARTRNMYVSYQNMQAVLNELLAWVKSYKYPLLNELLRTPAHPHAQIAQFHTNNRSKEHQGWQCDSTNNACNVRFSSELSGRDSAINVNSSAISTTQPAQSIITPVQSLPNYETLIQLANPSTYVEEFQTYTRQINQSLFSGLTEDPKNNVGKKKRRPKQNQNHPEVSVQELQTGTLPPPLHADSTSAQRNYLDNHLISSANYDSFQPQNQACQVNRSLSRDSGIVSPRSPANDFDYSSVAMTPLITHVTSLNPSATQIKDGVCLVCGTATKQMCLGCYNAYYCSNQCQISDWTTHVGFCK